MSQFLYAGISRRRPTSAPSSNGVFNSLALLLSSAPCISLVDAGKKNRVIGSIVCVVRTTSWYSALVILPCNNSIAASCTGVVLFTIAGFDLPLPSRLGCQSICCLAVGSALGSLLVGRFVSQIDAYFM